MNERTQEQEKVDRLMGAFDIMNTAQISLMEEWVRVMKGTLDALPDDDIRVVTRAAYLSWKARREQ